jgi:hypothetical protein
MKKSLVTLFALGCLALSSAAAFAAVPNVIPYQGRLTDAAGNPINGAQNIVFRIFTVVTGGTAAYTETQNGVTVTNGLFNVNIGSVTALPPAIFTGGDLFLEIQAGAEVMAPRQRLGTVPYAFRAGVGGGVASATASTVAIAAGTTGNLVTLVVDFPAAGVALVQGSVWYEIPHSNGASSNINVSINDVSATQHSASGAYAFFSSNSPTQTVDGTLAVQRTFNVTAGPKTFFLIGARISGNPIFAGNRLAVTYFPDAVGPVAREIDPPSREGTVPRTEAERQALSGD